MAKMKFIYQTKLKKILILLTIPIWLLVKPAYCEHIKIFDNKHRIVGQINTTTGVVFDRNHRMIGRVSIIKNSSRSNYSSNNISGSSSSLTTDTTVKYFSRSSFKPIYIIESEIIPFKPYNPNIKWSPRR
jgi:hypothetical protein